MRSEKILGACFKSCWNNNKWRACFSTVCLEKIPKCLWMCQLSFKWKCFLLPLKNLPQTIVFAEPLLLGDVWFLNWDSECVRCHMFEGWSLWDVWIMPCAVDNKAGWLQFGAFSLPFFDSSQSFFLKCSAYQDLCGLNSKLTLQERRFSEALMCDFEWTRANVMYMREKTPIKEGATLPGKSHHYFFETHSNSDKGHESNRTLRRGQESKSVCVCVRFSASVYLAQWTSKTGQ